MPRNSPALCEDSSTPIIMPTSVAIADGLMLVQVSDHAPDETDMDFNLDDIIKSLASDRSSLENPLVPDGLIDWSSLIKRLLPLTHNGRALRSDVDYGIAEFIARLLKAVTTAEDGSEDVAGGIICLAVLLVRLADVVADRYGDTSLEELLIDALHQDDLRALASDFTAIPVSLDTNGLPTPTLGPIQLFFALRPITLQMRDGYVQRRKLPYIGAELNDVDLCRDEDFEVHELSDFDNLIADCCEGFDDYENFYFENEDRYHDG
jgi:hypothetical protein